MIKLVLDTNSAVSGLLDYGAPRGVFVLAYRRRVQLWGSSDSYSEFCRVVRYPRLERRILSRYLSIAGIEYEYSRMLNLCQTEGIAEEFRLDPDPDDEEFIRIALGSSADYLLSRDNHLLGLEDSLGIDVLRPSEFMELWRAGKIASVEADTTADRRTWKVWGAND